MSEDQSVTVVTSRRVKPGCEAAFEQWLEGIGVEAAKMPGFVARRITRPADHDRPEYVVVFKFSSYATLRGWTESAVRKKWLDEVRPLVLDEYKETALTGLEGWFTVPGKPGLPPPPKYKMAAVTFLVVYPLSLGLSAWVAPLLTPLPAAARGLVQSLVMILLMTWVLMPRAMWLFKRWLFAA
jgi:antibiotic biosynthesis monooxygenase (ABM) superfamily enzyme